MPQLHHCSPSSGGSAESEQHFSYNHFKISTDLKNAWMWQQGHGALVASAILFQAKMPWRKSPRGQADFAGLPAEPIAGHYRNYCLETATIQAHRKGAPQEFHTAQPPHCSLLHTATQRSWSTPSRDHPPTGAGFCLAAPYLVPGVVVVGGLVDLHVPIHELCRRQPRLLRQQLLLIRLLRAAREGHCLVLALGNAGPA